MSPFRFRDHDEDDDSSPVATIATVLIGAVAGFAVGMYVAQRFGGFDGIKSRLTGRNGKQPGTPVGLTSDDELDTDELDYPEMGVSASADDDFNGMDDDGDDDYDTPDIPDTPVLEERVLEAFTNDPMLAERAIDIGAIGTGVIELAGWVESDDEAERAMTIAQGIPGVNTVVNRLMVDDEEQEIGETIRRARAGDPALNDRGWEGQQVGTGKRRQGSSSETDRHADPKPELGDRWLSEREALKNSAEDLDEITAERRSRKKAKGEAQPEA